MAADGPGVPGSEPVSSAAALDRFPAATRAWFEGAFAVPTQAQAWRAIGKGENTLVIAPIGSGKTLAAFLWAIDRLAAAPPPADRKRRTRVLYVSPLKAPQQAHYADLARMRIDGCVGLAPLKIIRFGAPAGGSA